ncbi:MAG: arylsulfatase [Opitutaceae bacterium]|nr:arylsulfatase [Opitutaceae bacterium]
MIPLRLALVVSLVAAHLAGAADAGGARPNILLIVADDLGYGDLGCYGATKVKTPNIDRLAGAGVRLTDAHAPAAVCQPSRYAILSGTYFRRAQRKGLQTLYFHEGQVTLPALLKSAGYRTAALGKWHLGFGRGAEPDYNGELKPGPLEIGFDSFFGCPRTHNEPPFVFVENHRVVGLDPADPIHIVPAADTKEGYGHGISTGAAKAHAARPKDRIDLILADKAVQFIAHPGSTPFFLYLAFLAPHVPIAPAPEFQDTSQAGRYGDFIQQLDTCVGRVLDALQASEAAGNTLVIFTSDNGAVLHRDALEAGHRANGSLLGQKTDAWEGGHRVPFIARWPGHIPAGTQSDQLLGLTDLMTTIAAAANVPLPAGTAPDSLNQLPVLREPRHAPGVRHEMLAQGTGGYALRQENWLFLPKQGSGGMTVQMPPGLQWGQPYAKLGLVNGDVDERGKIRSEAAAQQLYDLAVDPGQSTNLAGREPQRTEALAARLEALLAETRTAPRAAPANPATMTPSVRAPRRPGEQFILINLSAADREPVIARIAREFKSSPGNPVRVGIGRIFSYFGRGRDRLEEELRKFLDLGVKYDLPVLVALDGEYWWEDRPDLWNWWQPERPGYNPANRENVEWTSWDSADALKIAWLNWGQQLRVLPPPNLMSPRYRGACHEQMRELVPIVTHWWKRLPPEKKNLFVGLKVGWESSIGVNKFYYPDGNALLDRPAADDPRTGIKATEIPARGVVQIGYAALKTSGLRTSGSITEEDLVEVVRRHVTDLSSVAAQLGVPRERLFTHVAGWKDDELLYDAAVNEFSSPGWSFYRHARNPSADTGVQRALARSDAPGWAAVEWLHQGPNTTEAWRSSLERTLAEPGCRFLCIFNWKNIATKPAALDAIRGVVTH